MTKRELFRIEQRFATHHTMRWYFKVDKCRQTSRFSRCPSRICRDIRVLICALRAAQKKEGETT